jgi:hypothetical protein
MHTMSDEVEEKEKVTEDPSIDQMVKVYIKIRDHLRQLQSEFAAKEEVFISQMETIQNHFLEKCKEIGAKNIKTKHGTIIRSVKTEYSTNDWESLYEYIDEHKVHDILHRRINQTNLKAWLEEHPTLMPKGMNVVNSYSITVRRSK